MRLGVAHLGGVGAGVLLMGKCRFSHRKINTEIYEIHGLSEAASDAGLLAKLYATGSINLKMKQ